MPLKVSDTELLWADDELVRQRLFEKGLIKDDALKDINYSDRTTHVYEGGFKASCYTSYTGCSAHHVLWVLIAFVSFNII